MTIPLSGSGGLFTRLGHLYGGIADTLALRGGTATTRVLSGANMASRVISTVEVDYANGTAIPQVVDGLLNTLSSFQSNLATLTSDFKTRAVNTLLAMYSLDQQGASSNGPLSQLTAGVNATMALQTLISQMNTAVATVQAATVAAGAFTAVGSPNGTPQIVTSLKNVQGLLLQLCFPETLTFKCTGDSQGSATLGNEPVQVTGQTAVTDPLSQLWPGGSGASVGLNAVDGSKSNSTGNVLQNSDFFTSTTPNYADNWTLQIGAAGVDVFTDTANAYTTGGGSLKFTGTGSALLDAVTQSFNTTPTVAINVGGTSFALKPSTVYHVNGWVKCSATPAAGVLEIALTDGTAYPGTVINDDQAAANLFTKSLTAVSTTYLPFNGAFRTPAVMPAATPYRLRVRLSTAIDSGKSAFVGRLSMTPATQLYPGGPFCSVHSGNAKLINGVNPDAWTVALTNNYSTSGSGLLQQYMERVFGLRALGLQIPYAGSPSILDTVIA